MKSFSYTYREKNGTIRKGNQKAVCRSAVLDWIKAQGHTPVEVSETAAAVALPRKAIAAAVGGVAVLALALVAMRLLSSGRTPEAPTPEAGLTGIRPSLAQPVARPVETPVEASVATPAEVSPARPQETPRTPPATTPAQPATAAQTPPTFAIRSPRQPEPVAEPKPPEPDRRMPESTTESLLSMLGRPGESIPPVPFAADGSSDGDFDNFLETDFTVLPDDPPKVVEQKEYMAWMRHYMLDAKEQGMAPGAFLRAMEDLRREESEELRVTLELYREIEIADPAAAPAALRELNAVLSERGLPPMQPRQRGR